VTQYSSPELDTRARSIITALQPRLTEAGIKSSIYEDFYRVLLVIEECPENYMAVSFGEDSSNQGSLLANLSTLKVEPYEALYQGTLLNESSPTFTEDLYDEILLQNKGAKKAYEQKEAKRQCVAESMQIEADICKEFPAFRKYIRRVSSYPVPVFELHIGHLSTNRLREVLKTLKLPT
jgi:hypothetical protein